MPKRHPTSLRYVLDPDPAALSEIRATLEAYGRMMRILDTVGAAQGGRANLARIHAAAYERVRAETGLPARLVTLGLRDHSLLVPGEPVVSLPLDEKLFSIKGPDTLSLATLSGRHLVRYRVKDYSAGWTDFAEARLHVDGDGVEIRVGVDVEAKEGRMAQEGILGRMGRIVSGATNALIDNIEGRAPVMVVEEALREIDRAAGDARAEYGRHVAEVHRIESGIRRIEAESKDLDEKIGTALAAGREDLARPVAARQVDLDAQAEALRAALEEARGNVEEGRRGIAAVEASRRECEQRLADLKRSVRGLDTSKPGAGSPARDRVGDAVRAVDRVTGLPGAPSTGAAELEELERIHRDRLIDQRLDRLRQKDGT